MGHAAYSVLKPAWHQDRIRDLKEGRRIVPAQVHFIISDLCNHDCHFCAYRMSTGFSSEQFGEDGNHNPNRKIPLEKCCEILDDLAELGVGAVQFTGGGEPTVHPDHMDIFYHAQSVGLQTSLVTNGSRLKRGFYSIFPHMSWIRVSVDAGLAQTYGHVRRIKPDVYDKVLGNIARMRKCLTEKESDCLLGAGFVVTRENWSEIVCGARKIKESGASYVRFAGMFSTDGTHYYEGIYDPIKKLIEQARELHEDESFKVVDLFGDRLEDLRLGAPDYDFCGYQEFVVYIGGNLKVYRCCTTSYTQHGEIGDLTDQRFKDWWVSSETREKYKTFCARSCKVCQFNDKNATINYLLDPNPQHVEFV